MALECPTCNSRAVERLGSMDLGPDDDSDETAIQLVACRGCGLNGIGWYEESRRGGGDSFHHWFNRVDAAALERCRAAIRGCAAGPKCRCAAHEDMRRFAGEQRWRA